MKSFINSKTSKATPLKFVRLLKIFVEKEALRDGFTDNSEWTNHRVSKKIDELHK